MGKIKIEVNYYVASTILKALKAEVKKFQGWIEELERLLDKSAVDSGIIVNDKGDINGS